MLAEVICWKHYLPPPTSPKSATYESLHLSWLWEGFFYKHFANFLQGEQKFQIFNVLRLLKCISWLLGRDAADVFPLIIRKYGVLLFYLHSVYKLLSFRWLKHFSLCSRSQNWRHEGTDGPQTEPAPSPNHRQPLSNLLVSHSAISLIALQAG